MGDPRHSLLNRVLETGQGTSAMLSIVFIELCMRCGLPLTASVLDDNYILCWPQQVGPPSCIPPCWLIHPHTRVPTPTQSESLSACGEQFVIDPYSSGALFSAQEVVELFALSSIQELHSLAADNAMLLGVCLADLQKTYFTAAQLSSKGDVLSPLRLRYVVDGDFAGLSAEACQQGKSMCTFFLQRALAAAERRTALLPDDAVALMHEALLLYILQRYGDARERLQVWVSRFKDGEYGSKVDDQATALLDKCTLMLRMRLPSVEDPL